MKKTVISLIVGASMVFASSAFALQTMSVDNMKDTTGQAGVSITVDDVIIETWVGTTSYTDLDGVGGTDTDPGSITISDKHTIKTYQAMTSATDTDGDGVLDTLASPGLLLTQTSLGILNEDSDHDGIADTYNAHALKIDVGNCAILAAGLAHNNSAPPAAVRVAGVVIGLPTLEINTSADTYTVGATLAGGQANPSTYIQISTGAKTQHILGGTVEIAPH